MSCLKNHQKFLWIKYHGDHDYKIIKAWKFMDCSDTFNVRYRCSLCGCEDESSFVTWDELLQYGLLNEQIQRIGTIRPFEDHSLRLNYIK